MENQKLSQIGHERCWLCPLNTLYSDSSEFLHPVLYTTSYISAFDLSYAPYIRIRVRTRTWIRIRIRMDGWVGGWIDGWMNGLMDKHIDRWMDGRKGIQIDRQMDRWIQICIHFRQDYRSGFSLLTLKSQLCWVQGTPGAMGKLITTRSTGRGEYIYSWICETRTTYRAQLVGGWFSRYPQNTPELQPLF